MTTTTAGCETARADATFNGKRRVLLVDDHPVVREGLSRIIGTQSDLVVCCQAGDVPGTLTRVRSGRPDVVVLDLCLGDGNGIDVVRQIHAIRPRLPVLILSQHDETLYAERALRAGAAGYVMKLEPPETVLRAIRTVARNQTWVSDSVSSRLLQVVRGGGAGLTDHPLQRLSDRELEVFRLIGQGLPVREIAESLFVSPKTVETHKEHIKQKLGLTTGNQLLQYAIQSHGRPD